MVKKKNHTYRARAGNSCLSLDNGNASSSTSTTLMAIPTTMRCADTHIAVQNPLCSSTQA